MFKFTQGDIVKRITKSRNLNSWHRIIELWIYKVSTVHNDYVTLEWIAWNISSDSLIEYKMQVWDYVRRIKKDYEDVIVWCIYKVSSILPRDIKIEWSLWAYSKDYFEPVLTTDNDCITNTPIIKIGDIVQRVYCSSLEVKEWCTYKVYDIDKDNDLSLMINWQPSTYLYASNWFIVIPNLAVGPVGPIGDSNSSNPITPMSKTFNDYAVEAFMSNEENRTAATNARNVLQTLVDNLDLSMAAIEKIKRVVYRDFRDLNGAMEDCDITTIAKLVAENPAVKEFVERFMDNTLVQLIPEPVVTSTSIQDKFK